MSHAPSPPRLARRLLERALPADARDHITNELDEVFRHRCASHGFARAQVWYWREALSFAIRFVKERVREKNKKQYLGGAKATGRTRRGWMTSTGVSWLDFKLGVRMLIKYPGLTLIGSLAIAIGIALAAGFFEFSNDLINPTLPLDEGDRIVAIQNWDVSSGSPEPRSLHDFVTWRDELESVEVIGAYRIIQRNVITDDGRIEPIRTAAMDASAFRLARVPPLLGRPLVEADDQAGAPPVAVIGHGLWQTRFGGDPDIVGRTVQLGSSKTMVVGVMPEGFLFPENDNLWLPLSLNVLGYERLEGPPIRIVGRLAPGVTLEEAQAELTALGLRAAADFPETNEQLRPRIMSYTDAVFVGPGTKRVIYMVQGFMVMILVVASVNVATLVFARTATREREIAVRSALGASRGRIVMQIFAESLVLASVAAMFGLALASLGLRQVAILAIDASSALPFWFDESLAAATFVYVGILTVLSAAIAGIVPAIKVTGRRVHGGLGPITAGGSGKRFGGFSTAVIVTQVALSVGILTIGLGMGREVMRYNVGEFEFPADEYLSMRLQMDREIPPSTQAETYEAEFTARYGDVYEEVARQVIAEPTISAVTFADRLPGMSHPRRFVEVDGIAAPHAAAIGHTVRGASVDVRFFEVLDTPILSGRGFNSGDAESGRNVVIVNRSFVSQVLGNQNPIGGRVRYAKPSEEEPAPWHEIVGVVSDLGMNPGDPAQAAGLYHPVAPGQAYPVRMAVRVQGDTEAVAPRLRSIATAVDPTTRLDRLTPLDEMGRADQRANRLAALVVSLVAGMILALSTAGTYALMSFTVSQRTREIGIRTALGARPQRILSAIFSRSLAQLTLGVIVGAVGAFALPGVIEETTSEKLVTLAAVSAVMIVAGLLACIVPARRGLRIQPTEALREG